MAIVQSVEKVKRDAAFWNKITEVTLETTRKVVNNQIAASGSPPRKKVSRIILQHPKSRKK
jgi:hypothetical protein